MDSSYYRVYTGAWINWSQGKVLGATLTTTPANGSLLVAFISLFVTIVGTQFWRIGCFVFHYVYSTETSRDGLYHQRQAVLRNSANGASGLWRLCQLLFAWKTTAEQPFRRVLPLVTFTLVTLGAFAAASTFSSRVSTLTGNAVLISPGHCGYQNLSLAKNLTNTDLVRDPYWAQKMDSSLNYVQQCYIGRSITEGCTVFVRNSIPAKAITNATCPFSEDICKTPDSNILLDTGYINSNLDLGLNMPRSKQWLYRRVTHCAPLKVEGYKRSVPKLEGGLDIPYIQYFYGHRKRDFNISRDEIPKPTYQYPAFSFNQTRAEDLIGPLPNYNLNYMTCNYANGTLDVDSSDFDPIQALRRSDAELYLIFLSANSIMYPVQTDDLWYSAHGYLGSGEKGGGGRTDFFHADEAASPLGCVVQHQFCRPGTDSSPSCTPLVPMLDVAKQTRTIWPKEEDWDGVMFAIYSSHLHGINLLAAIIDSAGVEASSRMSWSQQGIIPKNQWQLDVQRWNNISLAFTQQGSLDAASGPSDSRINEVIQGPQTAEERRICSSQMMRTTAYTNFSIFGLATIFIVGGLIITISYTLEPFIDWLRRRRNSDAYANLEWAMNETLQLQRMAHEELGMGAWKHCNKDVPITEGRDRLAMLDLDNLEHPKLKAPPISFEQILAGRKEGHEQANVVEQPSDGPTTMGNSSSADDAEPS